jgi:hypothetical protein
MTLRKKAELLWTKRPTEKGHRHRPKLEAIASAKDIGHGRTAAIQP